METPSLPSNATVVGHPAAAIKLTRLRDQSTRPEEFRARLKEIATLLICEATRDLGTRVERIRTPLAECDGTVPARPMVLVPILRAGTGLVDGMLSVFPDAMVAHVGMRRDEKTHRPHCYYFNVPGQIADAEVIVADPMLATGHSASGTISKLKEAGARRIRFICCVSCPEGLRHLWEVHPDVRVFTAAVDPGLDERAYIVPGLGDAGDRYFGTTT